jgi:hypothetical protein
MHLQFDNVFPVETAGVGIEYHNSLVDKPSVVSIKTSKMSVSVFDFKGLYHFVAVVYRILFLLGK